MISKIRDRNNPEEPPAISSDGNDSYPEAMLDTWESYPITLVEVDLQLASDHSLSGNAFKSPGLRPGKRQTQSAAWPSIDRVGG
jgi:hypothetical protein